MLTREQWNALTPDEQWGRYTHSAMTTSGYVRYSDEGIPLDYVTVSPQAIPVDPLPEKFRIYGNDGSFRLAQNAPMPNWEWNALLPIWDANGQD
jgi:hypothetical protein